jgi:hypothetical protein
MIEKVEKKLIKATHSGEINIGNIIIPCYVLEDGTRVITQTGAVQSLGMSRFLQLSKLASRNSLKPFINQELSGFLNNPIIFKMPHGGSSAKGIKATILADICDVVLQARKEGVLKDTQMHIAEQCEMLTRSFAKVGIIALIDEATGYQGVRERDALQKILDAYLSKELSAWAKRFPDEFYKEIFRLKGWPYNPTSVKRPSCVANYTTNIVYSRLAPGIVEELEKKNPSNEKGARKHKHHQFLTDDIGHPALSQHIYGVIGLMRTQQTWEQFIRLLNRAYPVKTIGELFDMTD